MSCVLLFYAYILRGKHSRSPKKVTLRDVALRMFRVGLEAVTSHRFAITEVDDAIADLSVVEEEVEDDKTAAMGFALRRRKDTVRYSERAKEFVEAIFNEGIRTVTISAEEAENRTWVARNMDGSRAFLPEERLNSRQISSYYSRIAAKRKTEAAKTTKAPRGGRVQASLAMPIW